MTTGAATHDLFISYSSKDLQRVQPIVELLSERGHRAWFDRRDLRPLDAALSARISTGIAGTRLTLAFVTEDYLHSDACKWELLKTPTAGGLERLLVVAEPGVQTRLSLLSENLQIQLPSDDAGRSALVEHAAAALARLPQPPERPRAADWWPDEWTGANFSGRLDERLWLLDAFTEHLGAPESANRSFDRAQLVGLGGQGKSLLALQFAKDFQGQFEAIARFDAGGDRVGGRVTDETELLDDLLGQVLAWAGERSARSGRPADLPHRHSPDAWRRTREIVAELVRMAQGRVLWIVDDLPAGLSATAVQRLTCPARGRTVVTTRRHDYDEHFEQATLSLRPMDADEAVFLLARGQRGVLERDYAVLAEIADEVEGHALALAVLAQRIAAWSARDVLDRLRGQPAAAVAELERAARRLGSFPSGHGATGPRGHGASIMATLAMSIDALDEPTARAILQLSTMWPTSQPIPFALLTAVIGPEAIDGVQELVASSLAEKDSDETLKIHALVSGVTEHLAESGSFRSPVAGLDLRTGAARWLAPTLRMRDAWSDADHGQTMWHLLGPIANELDDADRVVAARALMALARLPMRHEPAELSGAALAEYLEEPLDWARRAERLREGPAPEQRLDVGRAQAMQGLLLMSQAEALPGSDAKVRLATQARELLERSFEIRLPILAGSTRAADIDELVRASFNFGRLVTLAKALAGTPSASEVAPTLDAAQQAYMRARDARQAWLDRPGPHERLHAAEDPAESLASCHRGLAIVSCTRATYQPGLSPAEREGLLAEALAHQAPARELTAQARARHAELRVNVASPDQAKDLEVLARVRLLAWIIQERERLDGPSLTAGLARVRPAVDLEVAERLAGALVPWGATDPSKLGIGLPPGFVDLARLRVQEARGGRCRTARAILADFVDNDVPALRRALAQEGRTDAG